MPVFQVHPDISQARTIHSSFYTDPELFRATKEMIFSSSWQFAGNTDLAPDPGAVHPFTLLPGYLDEPLLLTRDSNQQLYCISNVCTHRGNLLADQPCTVSHLRCKYHGRVFKLDGSFQSMPEFKEVQGFPSAADHLAQLLLFRWGKWLFTTLSGAVNADLFLNEMMQRVAWLPIDEFVYRPDLDRTYEVKAHWALYCENYLEGFHIPFVHADLNAVIDYGNYTTELFEWSNLQVGFAKGADDCFTIPEN